MGSNDSINSPAIFLPCFTSYYFLRNGRILRGKLKTRRPNPRLSLWDAACNYLGAKRGERGGCWFLSNVSSRAARVPRQNVPRKTSVPPTPLAIPRFVRAQQWFITAGLRLLVRPHNANHNKRWRQPSARLVDACQKLCVKKIVVNGERIVNIFRVYCICIIRIKKKL